MALRKFQPSAQGRGFNPVKVSDANIARMAQESDRILQGMRARRDADLANRRQQLEDMRSDAAYYEKVRKRDFDIASNNLETRQKQIQYDYAEQARRSRESAEGADKIFSQLSSFSATAAKEQAALRKEQEEKGRREGYAAVMAGMAEPYEDQFVWKEKANKLEDQNQRIDATVDLAEAQGKIDPNSAAKVRFLTSAQQEGAKQALHVLRVRKEFPGLYQQALADAGVGSDPAAATVLGQEVLYELLAQPGFPQNMDALLPAIEEGRRLISNATSVSVKLNTDMINAETERRETNYAAANPEEYLGPGFRKIRSIYGNEYAHNWFKNIVTAQNPEDGSFLVSDEVWQNTDLYEAKDAEGNIVVPGKFGAYKKDHELRSIEIQNLRKQKQDEYFKGQMETDRLDYHRESRDAWQLFQQEPTLESLAAIEEGFSDNPEGVPEWVVRQKERLDPANAPYRQQLILAAKDAKERGILTQGLITEINTFDPKLANELQAALDKQDPIVNNPNFKEQLKAVQNLVKKPTASVPFPSDNDDSVRASRILGNELQRITTKLSVKYGGSTQAIIQASDEAAEAIQQKLVRDSTDPKAKYYRVYDPTTGLYSFPNLTDRGISQTERSKQQSKQFFQAMQGGRQQELINTKFGVLTESELRTEVKNMQKPGYVPNMKLVMASKGVEGGIVKVLNKQIQLSGIAGLTPVQPPESLQRVGAYSPAAQRHLSRYLNADTSTRIHGFEGSKLDLQWNRHLVPAQYRESIERHAATYGVPAALISAKLEVESTWGLNRSSPAGAKGIAQFTDATARAYGVNVNDDNSSIQGAAKYLRDLLKRFDNDPIIAAAAYNVGPTYMERHLKDPTSNPLPNETVNHMKKITKALYKYSGDARLLQRPESMRTGSPISSAAYQATPLRPLKSFAPQVSSVTFDTGQSGIDVFFEDKQFPAVLSGVVKDISFQGGQGYGYGNYVVIESVDPETNQKVDVLYAHLASKPNLRPGQTIRTGQIIGQQGGTGRVVSADGTIASIDFLRPAPRGSKDMTPYSNFESLRRRIASQLRS